MRCEKNGRMIKASDRTFRVVYRNQGYIPARPPDAGGTEDEAVPGEKTGFGEKELNDMTIAELKETAKKKGLQGYSSLSRAELLELVGGEMHD